MRDRGDVAACLNAQERLLSRVPASAGRNSSCRCFFPTESFGEPECGADEATALNRQLVEGGLVELLPGPQERDKFGRLLRYVFAEGVFVNAELVREGMARAQSFHSEERFAQILVQLEVAARNASRGSWEDCDWK